LTCAARPYPGREPLAIPRKHRARGTRHVERATPRSWIRRAGSVRTWGGRRCGRTCRIRPIGPGS